MLSLYCLPRFPVQLHPQIPPRIRSQEYLLDRRIAAAFGLMGVHNCAWKANPYLEHRSLVSRICG